MSCGFDGMEADELSYSLHVNVVNVESGSLRKNPNAIQGVSKSIVAISHNTAIQQPIHGAVVRLCANPAGMAISAATEKPRTTQRECKICTSQAQARERRVAPRVLARRSYKGDLEVIYGGKVG